MKERELEERLEENQSKLWLCKYESNYGPSYDGKLQICDKKEIHIKIELHQS